MKKSDLLRIGELAARSGVAASALRFYEAQGLIASTCRAGGVRVFARATLRRVAFIQAAQRIGLTLDEIRGALATLPKSRTPTRADWAALSRGWKPRIERKIAELQSLRDELEDCIGCGCLSLQRCAIFNPQDVDAGLGPGARRWAASGLA